MKGKIFFLIGCLMGICLQPKLQAAQESFRVDPLELQDFFQMQDAYYEANKFNSKSLDNENSSFFVTESSLETVGWELELMRNAKHSIELTGFCGGQIFRDMLAAMEEKMEAFPHFQVHIITSPTLFEPEEEAKITFLQKRFPHQFHFLFSANVLVLLPDLTTIDNHVKVVIIDEKYFTTGGTNKDDALSTDGTYPVPRNNKGGIVGAYLPAGVRDMDIVGFGPMAKTLRLQYFKLFALWDHYKTYGSLPRSDEQAQHLNRYAPIISKEVAVIENVDSNPRLIRDASIKMIFSGPMDIPNKISKEYERLIDEARSHVVVANLYWNPTDMILKAAVRAVNRDIAFTVYTNGINDLTPKYNDLFAWASRINYVPIFFGRDFHIWEYFVAKKTPVLNTRIFEYHVKDILYHKKIMIVDDRYVLIGSYNLGTKSHKSDYELVVVIDSKQAAQDITRVLQKDQGLSLEISAEQAREWYFNPVTAYLAGTQKSFHGFMNVPFEQEDETKVNDLAKKMKEWNNQPLFKN